MEELDLLQEIGLTKAEAKIYMTLLRHGPLNAGRIVVLSHQHISVTYAAIQRLLEKGYITYIKKGKFNEYFATDPEILIDKIKETVRNVEAVLPKWKSYAKMIEENISVEIFEGMKGVTSMYNQMLRHGKKGEAYRIFTLGKENKEAVATFFKKIGDKRVKLGIKTKAITNKNYVYTWDVVKDIEYLKSLNLRLVSFDFPQGVVIYKNYIIFFSWGKIPKAIQIKDEKLAKEYVKFFDKLYATGEPYKSPK